MEAPEAALAFLREFGGLDLRLPTACLLGFPIGRWVVELGCHEPDTEGGYGLLPDDYADLKQLIGPCGLISQFPEGFTVYVVSEEGVMYDVGIDYPGGVQEVTPVGWSAREALENLCNARLVSRDKRVFSKNSRKKLREIRQARRGQGQEKNRQAQSGPERT